jgi:hypothetical protein
MSDTLASSPVRLGVPRHLQDCNGYCGPACVMMVHSGESPCTCLQSDNRPGSVHGRYVVIIPSKQKTLTGDGRNTPPEHYARNISFHAFADVHSS